MEDQDKSKQGVVLSNGDLLRDVERILSKVVLFKIAIRQLKKVRWFLLKKINQIRLNRDVLKVLIPSIDLEDQERMAVFKEPAECSAKITLKSSDAPKVSLIIPVYNQFRYTYNCLKSISLLADKTPYEIIIADDNSDDKTRDILNIVKGIRVVKNQGERGFLHNCNFAAKEAKGEYIYFLNNDTALFDGAIDILVETLERDKTIGLVGSKLINADLTLQEAGGIIWNDASGCNYGRNNSPIKPEYMYLKEVDYISGAAIMLSKALWEKIGGFDTRYAPAYYEDTDLAFEIRKRGYKVVFQPRSVVMHFEGKSCGTDLNSGIKSYQVTNQKKFYEKWQEVLKQHLPPTRDYFHVRDRSSNKKTILFLDYTFPTFDCDAGSRNIFSYIKLYLAQGFNVKFIPCDGQRLPYYSDVFENFGIECLYGQLSDYLMWRKWLKKYGHYIDYVYIHRSQVAKTFLPLLKKYTSAKTFFNVADLAHLRMLEQQKVEKDLYPFCIQVVKRREINAIKAVDYCTSVSQEEVTYINENIKKNAVWTPIFFYNKAELSKTVPAFEERKDILFVAGFKHLPNVDAVKWFVNDIFPKLRVKTDMKLHIVGSYPPADILSLAGDNIMVHGYVSDEKLRQFYNQCRVSVIPLRYGGGLKGKTLESIFNFLPFVGTDFAIQGFPEKSTYFTAHNEAETFAAEVIRLYSDKDAWEKEQKKYREYLEKYFTSERAVEIMNDIFPL